MGQQYSEVKCPSATAIFGLGAESIKVGLALIYKRCCCGGCPRAPTSPRSIGFCAIWESISSSSSSRLSPLVVAAVSAAAAADDDDDGGGGDDNDDDDDSDSDDNYDDDGDAFLGLTHL